MTIRPLLAASLFALTALASVPVLAKDSAKSSGAYATVNGKAIPKAYADALIASQEAQGQKDSPELDKAVKEELVRREILAEEATKKGIDKRPDVKAQMDMARQGVLIGAYLQDYVKSHPVSDADVQKEYDTIRAALGDKEYKARHILVDNEAEANDIIAKLKKGERFEDLAKAHSKDPGSKDKGGDLGWANKAAYVKPFSDAMVALQKGKFTEKPVKSDFGWHVIMLDDVRDLKAPSLDSVKGQLTGRLQQQMVEKHIAELRKAAKVD
jgi:peptidyl-prolyl cis-trans isomerase C